MGAERLFFREHKRKAQPNLLPRLHPPAKCRRSRGMLSCVKQGRWVGEGGSPFDVCISRFSLSLASEARARLRIFIFSTYLGYLCILSITAAFVRLGGALGLIRSVAQSYRGFMVGVSDSVRILSPNIARYRGCDIVKNSR